MTVKRSNPASKLLSPDEPIGDRGSLLVMMFYLVSFLGLTLFCLVGMLVRWWS